MQPTERLVGLGRLRGLAALCVVFGHAFHVHSLNAAKELFNPAFLVVASGTVLFVLIAGVLFRMKAVARLINGETSTTTILRRRWAELSGTYLTVGLFMAIVFGWSVGMQEGVNPVLHTLRMMLNGSMAHSYWYVPFFLLLMAMSPLHVAFSRLNLPLQIVLIILGLIVSAFIHRPNEDVTLGAAYAIAYYIPVFWIGLVLGAHWQAVMHWMQGRELFLGLVFLGIIALQTMIGQDGAYLHKPGEDWGKVDLFIVQKVVFGLLLLSLLQRSQTSKMPVLDWLSKNSLTIFFMHSPVLLMVMALPHLSGFYVPELVLVTAITIVGGVMLHDTLVRSFQRLPEGIKCRATAIREARFGDLFSNPIPVTATAPQVER